MTAPLSQPSLERLEKAIDAVTDVTEPSIWAALAAVRSELATLRDQQDTLLTALLGEPFGPEGGRRDGLPLLWLRSVVTDYGAMLRGELNPTNHPDPAAALEGYLEADRTIDALRAAVAPREGTPE